MSQEYIVHDNGGRPFKVLVYTDSSSTSVSVSKRIASDKYHLLVEYPNVLHVMVGKNPQPKIDVIEKNLMMTFDGNTIVLQIDINRYVFIGQDVYEFSLADGDIIEEYYSPVVNSDVPYPVIKGRDYGYFMLDKKMIRMEDLCIEEWSDAYGDYYEYEQKQIVQIHDMPDVKMICERIWL
jgi:hypothetical protein